MCISDRMETDHCPGFASAAKYIATSIMEVARDSQSYEAGMITVIECMGRHAGWLTAASVLASYAGCGPDLIYVPEVDFDIEQFRADVPGAAEQLREAMNHAAYRAWGRGRVYRN